MRIDKIILNNFGSYEGETIFDTHAESGKNIILVGGKNGAGKTTLFTAMRVCLYGYMSMGYKNHNAFYNRAITKLINNAAKMSKPAFAHVSMQISMSNGREMDNYVLRRAWELSDTITEVFTVTRNGIHLTSEEIADFEKYILSLIPPELFNLYFFDGEKIADFFMNEGGNTRIKAAFLTLCGYDTFDIMRRNFKRISSNSSAAPVLDAYWTAKQEAATEMERYQALQADLKTCVDELDLCEAEIAALEKNYTQKGGISQEEWNQKLIQIREEEKKREVWNAMLRKWANDMVPFLMLRDQIIEIKDQIAAENNSQKYLSFCEILDSPEVKALIGSQTDAVRSIVSKQFGRTEEMILDLSLEQSAAILAQINTILDFDPEKITKYRNTIKKSIAFSAKLRQELDNSNIATVQTYMKRKAELFEQKSDLLNRRVELEQQLVRQKEALQKAEMSLAKTQSKLEGDIKKASINDISAKAIVMLDRLQKILYRQQITRVENFFRAEIRTLMRKTHFIDDIRIDDDFNIYLYRYEGISADLLLDTLAAGSEDHFRATIGAEALEELQRLARSSAVEALSFYCAGLTGQEIVLPIRIDQASLSNGEKQIFIMALYHALVQLGRHEIPFIIDTPFARIDTEHRHNISKHFFCNLRGQVFILSTNEEINSDHVQIMKERIAATYMLENTDNKRTTVVQDTYFEV